MASNDDLKTQESLMDSSCRILTISATISGATTFIEQLKALGTPSQPSPDPSTPTLATPQTVSSDAAAHPYIPWTITNRYYTADVHFAPLRMEAVGSSTFAAGTRQRPPPAIVYVWTEGEPYINHITELSRIMASESYEPEVSLAVRIPALKPDAEPSTSLTRKDGEAEYSGTNGDIDNTLMSYGFEYIDGTQLLEASTRTSGVSPDDVPGLPRVLDALGTIMWPSMKSAAKQASSSTKALVDEKSQREHDDIMEELLAHGRDASFASAQSDAESKVHESQDSEDEDADLLVQMHAFVRDSQKSKGGVPSVSVDGTPFSPYDFNSSDGQVQRPWIKTGADISTGGDMPMSPTDMDATTPFGSRGPSAAGGADDNAKEVSLGFEDDFTVFVSAPALPSRPATLDLGDAAFGAGEVDGPDVTTPTATGALTTGGLVPESVSARRNVYRSLGSVSDFGGSDDGREHEAAYEALQDDDGNEEWEDVDSDEDGESEECLPSREEVREAAARIFGGAIAPGAVPGIGGAGVGASASARGGASSSSSSKPSGAARPTASGPAGGSAGGGGTTSASASSPDSGPPAAMLERMRMLGRMAASQDIMTGMGAMRARSGAATSAQPPGASASDEADLDLDAGDEDGSGARPFDLERVFGALQQYKSEIAGMQNDEERRRAAATVALGLVYGLEGGRP